MERASVSALASGARRAIVSCVPPRRIAKIITAATHDRVVVCEAELEHAARHFLLPRDLLLDLIERVLTQPTAVYADDTRRPSEYRLFYRLEDGRYILAVVKLVTDGAYFASLYPTGRRIRTTHRKFRRVL
ncbi:MAG TPA: PBECR2 nuclease fold domain-containing protein [Candidatus Acidoferrales bacterium]|nr:PBECR2 nuclease fold domain-containing protein [Candidatus Acidoferrales bacterium]